MRANLHYLVIAAVAAFGPRLMPVRADGTVGRSRTLAGPNYIIGAIFRGLGKNVTASGGTGVNGSIGMGPDRSDVAQLLGKLPEELLSLNVRLQLQCGAGGNFSSFLNRGKGGLSLDSATWQTSDSRDDGSKP